VAAMAEPIARRPASTDRVATSRPTRTSPSLAAFLLVALLLAAHVRRMRSSSRS
jgi:MYXO-CTERM domain-containing protein